MKKILLIFIFLSIFSSQNYHFSFAESSPVYYAKVEHEGYFYSSANENTALFQLPTSYFVLLTGEENSSFFKASYKGLDGFVKKSEVTPMSGTPSSPYPNANFRVFAKEGLGLYSAPSSSSSLVSTIPYLYKELEFYGFMTGEIDIPQKSNQWYYCKYISSYGYLYSVFCDNLPTIEKNTESFDIISPTFNQSSVATLSKSSLVWIIVGVGLPSLVVLFLLLKPSLIKERILNGKAKPRRRKDYFEFDDSSLN